MPNLSFLLHLQKKIEETPSCSVREVLVEFQEEQPDFEIINKEVIQMHLYTNIVLAWEKLKKKLPKKMLVADLDNEQWGYFKILNHNPKQPIHRLDVRFFLRKLRNALSHNQVKINKDFSVIFRDRDNSKIKYEWEELLKLIQQIQALSRS